MIPLPRILNYGNKAVEIKNDQYQNDNPNILNGTSSVLTTNSIFAQNGPRGCSYREKVYLAGNTGSIMYINGTNDTYNVITQRPIQTRNMGICANAEYIYCIGGYINSTSTGTNAIHRYNISTNIWTQIGSYPITAWNLGTAYDIDRDDIYIMSVNGFNPSLRKYTPSTGVMVQITTPFTFTYNSASLVYNDGILYCLLDQYLYKYDIKSNIWTSLPIFSAISSSSNKYCSMGLMGSNLYVVTNDVAGTWKYSIKDSIWTRINTTVTPRNNEPAIGCAYNRAYAVANTTVYKLI